MKSLRILEIPEWKARILISDFDLLIGCTAVANNLIMVTENVKEFERISDIKIENWIKR